MENLISLVNKLQRACTALRDQGEESALPALWDSLPSIAAVGCQSSGKSSVLESIVGRDFLPRGSGIVTRRPLVLQLHRIDENREYAEFLHQPRKTYTDFAKVRQEIADETDRETGHSKRISSDPIHLSIFSPNVVNLTLIDLPGLTKIDVDSHSDSIIAQEIENMVRAFIEKPDCIILTVCPASQDLATSDAIKISREVDPKGERTFGVLTKIDLMEDGNNAVNILEGGSYRFQSPWVGVLNRSQKDINEHMDMIAAKQTEHDYFANTPEYKHLAHRMGSEHLVMSLSRHIESVIKSRIPASYLFTDCHIESQVTQKNRLQGYTLRAYGKFPSYLLCTEGEPHNMRFHCTVQVQDQRFESAMSHTHRKDAEEDAANVAYSALMGNESIENFYELINKDSICKINLLNEYLLKNKMSGEASADPVYASSRVAAESQLNLWLSTVTLHGRTYIGDVARTKRSSVQKAASAVILSMLEAGESLMVKVLLSKRLKATVPRRKDSAGSSVKKKTKSMSNGACDLYIACLKKTKASVLAINRFFRGGGDQHL